mmetsp:Transcript_21750/g.31906  ORF Transcript_21750/g.31906 Transcript_21750/m.31906 type:complete len:366 (-) Transcript_21750:849-1946(-)
MLGGGGKPGGMPGGGGIPIEPAPPAGFGGGGGAPLGGMPGTMDPATFDSARAIMSATLCSAFEIGLPLVATAACLAASRVDCLLSAEPSHTTLVAAGADAALLLSPNTSSSVPKISFRLAAIFARLRPTSSPSANVSSFSPALTRPLFSFHFGSRRAILMCSAICSTGTCCPVMGEIMKAVAADFPPSAPASPGFRWSLTIFIGPSASAGASNSLGLTSTGATSEGADTPSSSISMSAPSSMSMSPPSSAAVSVACSCAVLAWRRSSFNSPSDRGGGRSASSSSAKSMVSTILKSCQSIAATVSFSRATLSSWSCRSFSRCASQSNFSNARTRMSARSSASLVSLADVSSGGLITLLYDSTSAVK